MKDIFIPELARIQSIKIETRDIKTLRLMFQNEETGKKFCFSAGQFIELSVPRVGESTFCIASAPSDTGYIECSIKKVGRVTEAIHMLEVGNKIGIRGPYGNCFPMETLKGKNLIFVGGGIGLAPLRALIREVLHKRSEFEDLMLIYGARTVSDLVYKDELEEWTKRSDLKTVLTVDPGGQSESWNGKVGFVPAILRDVSPIRENSVVITCGPPIMIKFVLLTLREMGFNPSQIITTLEMKMKCGVGKCGRCNIGPFYVCKDGPVFTLEQIEGFVEEIF
jgi:sulfhydrogenase subunit gamma (sulfur reductase)